MKLKIEVNTKEKELKEYLATEKSANDFIYCIANDIDWDYFLKEKGLIEIEEVEYDEPLDLPNLK